MSWCEADQSDQKSDKEDTESSRAEQQVEHPTINREHATTLNLRVDLPDMDINSERELEDCSAERRRSEEKDETVPSITAVSLRSREGPGTSKKNIDNTVNTDNAEKALAQLVTAERRVARNTGQGRGGRGTDNADNTIDQR